MWCRPSRSDITQALSRLVWNVPSLSLRSPKIGLDSRRSSCGQVRSFICARSYACSWHRLADLVDLHRAHPLVVVRGVEPADFETRQIIQQKGVGAHSVKRSDVAREQCTPFFIGEVERA